MISSEPALIAASQVPPGWTQAAPPQNFLPNNPAGTSNTTLTNMGLGSQVTYTPKSSGTLLVVAAGSGYNAGTGGFGVSGLYGTGTAPSNGANPAVGTQWGAVAPNYGPFGANNVAGWACNGVITGLQPGVPVWIDLGVQANTSGEAFVHKISVSIVETS